LPNAFFLPVEPGERFCICHPPAQGRHRGRGLVYVHPFAEEMNKARRMAALQARSLAAEGFWVLQIDLLGCGDSSGDFADARWNLWIRDVSAAVQWLREHVPTVSLWGLRLGALLAAEVARDPQVGIDHLLLWQPVVNGAQFMTQFLRLRLASEMLADGAASSAIDGLRARLAGGESLEIAGYELHPELASAIGQLNLATPIPGLKNVHWMELGDDPAAPLRPASRRVLDAWRAAGVEVKTAMVAGEPFWSTLEIAECEPLLRATTEAMNSFA
jgi:exosortase A-associated hydrolase 2